MRLAIDAISLPLKRPFRWRAVWILGVFFIVGKLANIPLLLVFRSSMEPMSTWVIGGGLGFVVKRSFPSTLDLPFLSDLGHRPFLLEANPSTSTMTRPGSSLLPQRRWKPIHVVT